MSQKLILVDDKDNFISYASLNDAHGGYGRHHRAVKAVKILKNNIDNNFTYDLEKFVKEFSKYSRKYFAEKSELSKKYPKIIQKYYEELNSFGSGGKAMRPYFIYLGYRLNGDKPIKRILPVCLAYELIHSFLLIHDDIIDKSDKRRFKPTVHKKFEDKAGFHYGLSHGILVGDLAFTEALSLVDDLKFSGSERLTIYNKIVEVVKETIYGEILDVEGAHSNSGYSLIKKVTELKTAKYSFVGPMVVGAILAKVSKVQIKAIEEYGRKCGRAFQLQDDVLGFFGREEVIGKSTLSDMREGKNTELIYKTRLKANKKDLLIINKNWGNQKAGQNELKQISKIIISSKAKEWCEREMVKLVSSAKKNIDKITKDKKLRLIFSQSADFVISRNF